MKLKKVRSILFILVTVGFIYVIKTNKYKHSEKNSSELSIQDKRKKHAQFLANSPFKETLKLNKQERKARGIPPNKYYEEQWELTMNPATGRPEPQKVLDLQEELRKKRKANRVPGDKDDNKWEDRGPNNVGGRTRVVLFDPNDPTHKRVFAGAVGGGLWYTNDIADPNEPWHEVTDVPGNMNISCLTVDPRDSNIWYLGTGELYTAGAAVGNGIYKSTNGGTSWEHLPLKLEDGSLAYESYGDKEGLAYITEIIARDNGVYTELYLGVGMNVNRYILERGTLKMSIIGKGSEGLYRSIDNGESWIRFENSSFENEFSKGHRMIPNDIELGADNTLWMSVKTNVHDFSWGGRIYKSSDGENWTLVNASPLPSADRIELAVSSTNPNKIYALAEGRTYSENYKSATTDFPHIYATEDGFETISELALPSDADDGIPASDFTRGQAFYDLVIEVDPNDDDVVYVGGIDLFRSTKGVNTSAPEDWKQISKWSNGNNLGNLSCSYVHADQHAFVFHPEDSNKAVVGCDGGVFYATDLSIAENNDVFIERNKEYNVMQFYYGDYGQDAANELIIGGSQDNGTQFINGAQPGTNEGIEIFGGDGVFSAINTENGYGIASYIYNYYYYFKIPYTGEHYIIDKAFEGLFGNPAGLDYNLNVLFTTGGSGRMNRYILGEKRAEKESLTNEKLFGVPSAFKVSPFTKSSTLLFVGMKTGELMKVSNANLSEEKIVWEEITGDDFLGSISDIEFGANESEIFVTLNNYGVKSIWYTSNGGISWHNKEGDLPDMPVRCILQNPLALNEVIVGTEIGIWKTENFNEKNPNWTQSYNGMRDVQVVVLDLRKADNKVLATTHGRGVFTGEFASQSRPTFTIESESNLVFGCKPKDTILNFKINRIGGFSDNIEIDISGLPEEVTSTIESENNTDYTISIGNLENIHQNEYVFTLTGTSLNQEISKDFVLNVQNGNSSIINLISPINGELEVSLSNPILSWETDKYATEYEVQIATDPTFKNLVEHGLTKDTSYKIKNKLSNATTYFWRVRGKNDCFTQSFSTPKYFRTQISCDELIYEKSTKVYIEGGQESFIYEMKLDSYNNAAISDINVSLGVFNLSSVRNLDVWLISPNNTEVKLYETDCRFLQNSLMDLKFDDEAINSLGCEHSPFGNTKPFESLSKFIGENSIGEWTLKIVVTNPIEGELGFRVINWSLEICNQEDYIGSNLILKEINVGSKGDFPLTQKYIKSSSEGSRPSEQRFMITRQPTLGEIRLDGISLVPGQSFTQQDINEGLVSYWNNNSSSNLDFFEVNISNATGGFLPDQKIEINILEDFRDDDKDGVSDDIDQCLNTVFNTKVDEFGCYISAYDNDDDGINNDKDICDDSINGEEVNLNGCARMKVNELWGLSRQGMGESDGEMFKFNYSTQESISIKNFDTDSLGTIAAGELVSTKDGNLYGTTIFGGEFEKGVIFRYNILSNEYNIVYDFKLGLDGSKPSGSGLIKGEDGSLYGIATKGGVHNTGVLFEYNPKTQNYRKMIDFPESIESEDGHGIIKVGNMMYGTTHQVYTGNLVIYSYDIISNEFLILVEPNDDNNALYPSGKLIEKNNALYGVAWGAGVNDGVLYKYDLSTREYSVSVEFDNEIGEGPIGGLTEGGDGFLYGLTYRGGYGNLGTLYRFDASTDQIQTVFEFGTLSAFSGNVSGNLLLADNGKMYGVTGHDWDWYDGFIFEYDLNREKVRFIYRFDESVPAEYSFVFPGKLLEVNDIDYDADWDNVLNDVDNCLNVFNYDQKDIDGDGIGDACDDDIDGDGVLNDVDECSETPLGEEVDDQGCSDSQKDDDGDGYMNNVDECPNTPVGEMVDIKGCSESELDDDMDGVPNYLDQCPNTQGAIVNEYGCVDLSPTNFEVEVIGETCADKSNGQITIEVTETYTYTATINGVIYDFTTSLTIDNLEPNDYTVCITLEEEPSFEQCFNLVVAGASIVTGKSSSKVTTEKIQETIELESGTAPYAVLVNGERVLETSNTTISLDVLNGDHISVSSKLQCEGMFEKRINLSNDIIVYPNPTDDFADILLPNVEMNEVEISLFNSNQQLLSKKTYKIAYGKVRISLKDKPTGVYLLQLDLNSPVNLKLIKQ